MKGRQQSFAWIDQRDCFAGIQLGNLPGQFNPDRASPDQQDAFRLRDPLVHQSHRGLRFRHPVRSHFGREWITRTRCQNQGVKLQMLPILQHHFIRFYIHNFTVQYLAAFQQIIVWDE